MRFYKIKTLFKLGIEDLCKNMNVFVYVLFPVLFAFWYSNMDSLSNEVAFSICILFNIAMVPIALMGTIIAEEKEKNTLRTLMLNNVKAMEILVAKALICLLFVVINNILIFFIAGIPMNQFVLFEIVGFMVGLAVILFGAIVGLLAKNQMSAGFLSIPFMIVFMIPLFTMQTTGFIVKISKLLPTNAMLELFNHISRDTMTISNIGTPCIIIIGWLLFSFVIFHFVYKKVGFDN